MSFLLTDVGGGVGEITETRRKHVGSGRICCHLAQVGLPGIRESDVNAKKDRSCRMRWMGY